MKNTKANKAKRIVISVINPVVWIMAVVMGVVGFCLFFWETFEENPFIPAEPSKDPGKDTEQPDKLKEWGSDNVYPKQQTTKTPPQMVFTTKEEDPDCDCGICKARRSGNMEGYVKGIRVLTPQIVKEREQKAVDNEDFEQAEFWRELNNKLNPYNNGRKPE